MVVLINLRELERVALVNKDKGIQLQEQRDNIAISKKNNELEKNQQEKFNEKYLEQLNTEIQNLTLKHKLSRKKLSDAAGESGEFSKQRVKLNDELEKIKSLIQPLELSKRNIEEETIQIIKGKI